MFLRHLIFFTFCASVFVAAAAGENPLIHYPCEAENFYQVRRTNSDNWWAARLYLNDYYFHNQVNLMVRTDKTGTIEVDRQFAEITGPNYGHTFHVIYYGTPQNLTYVDFKVIGIDKTFPNLISLKINGQSVCHSLKQWVSNNVETTPRPQTSLLAGFISPSSQDSPLDNAPRPHHKPHLVTEPSIHRTTTRPVPILTGFLNQQQATSHECGQKKVHTQAFITNGWKTKPGDWPWHAAIYHRDDRTSAYKCGGTLLNKKTVLTAAHCCYSYGNLLIPKRLSVQLGKYDLNHFDTNSVEFNVYNIIAHPEYDIVAYTNDLALLQLAEQVTLSNYIQPICLWKAEKEDLKTVVNKIGTVVGWGLNERNQKGTTMSEATMPVVDFHACLESDRDFFGSFLSDYNFCAGFKNGTSVCQGDSGGGMFFNDRGTWFIRGLVSHGTVIEGTNYCNPKSFVIFTDIAKYRSWITENW